MRTYLLSLLCFSILFFNSGIAQNNSSKKAKENLKKAVDDLKDVFKPKKKEPVVTSQPAESNKSGTFSTDGSKNQLKPGDVLPGAKYVDADVLSNFSGGAAVIKKGSATALIDAKGNFIVPYNTYHFEDNYVRGSLNGIVLNGLFQFQPIAGGGAGGVMTSKGKIIYQGPTAASFSDNNKLIRIYEGNKQTYITAEGNKYSLPLQVVKFNENIAAINKGQKWGYIRLTGEALTDFIYDEVSAFSEGMAVVGKKNEFGEMKYGYINKEGKLAIPLNFSLRPGDFHSGFARVVPKDKSEFQSAYINKKGEVVWKQSLNDVLKYNVFESFTNHGLSYGHGYILDSTMKIVSLKDFCANYGIKDVAALVNNSIYVENETNPKLFFYTNSGRSPVSGNGTYGFVNLGTKKAVPPVFEMIHQEKIYFDPVSKLSLLKVAIEVNANREIVYREGYVNEDGLFVIVKGAASKW